MKRIRKQGELTPVVQTFSSDGVAFRMDFRSDSKCLSNRRCCKWGVWVHFRCIELVAVGWCIRKWLRLHQTIRNLTSGDMGILLVVIRLGVTGLKKTRVMCLSDLFEGRGEKRQYDLVCVERLPMIGLMVVMWMSY